MDSCTISTVSISSLCSLRMFKVIPLFFLFHLSHSITVFKFELAGVLFIDINGYGAGKSHAAVIRIRNDGHVASQSRIEHH